MPAGNDAKQAAAELADQIGSGTGSADDLIQASRERYRGGLGAAQLKDATEVTDLDAVAKAAGVDEVLSAAQRGEHVVYVYEDEAGRAQKGIVEASDLGSAPKPKAKAKKAKKEEQPEVVETAGDDSDE